jgi:Ca2+-binding EF-hand superfamily protein
MPLRPFILACAFLAALPAGAAEPAASAPAEQKPAVSAPAAKTPASAEAVRTETARLLEEQRNFELADVDGDFKLSWEEFRNFFVPQFAALDRDGDGVIRGAEHPPARDAAGKAVNPPDVTTEQFQRALRAAFEAADRDKSGFLDAREWATPLN